MTTQNPSRTPIGEVLWRGLPSLLVIVVAAGLALGEVAQRSAVGRDVLGGSSLVHGPVVLVVVLVAAQGILLWWRQRFAGSVLLAVTVIDMALLVVTRGDLGVGSIAVLVAAYVLGLRSLGRPDLLILTGAAAVSTVAAWIAYAGGDTVPRGLELPLAVFRTLLTYLLPVLIAHLVGTRARILEGLRERAEYAERERALLAREAVEKERTLMARELHDIAAHHLSGMILGSQAARALVDADPTRAGEYMGDVAREAQQTLANLRQTVGLLRTDSEGSRSPAPDIGQIPDLVESLTAAGMDIDLRTTGTPRPLGPVAEISAYRMVQESLVNARRHAPAARCTVLLAYRDGGADITVTNERATRPAGPGGGGGFGLVGMEERAVLTGARLTTGPTAEGGWENHLVLPPQDTPGSFFRTGEDS
ncbi:sensor histidine kinase [Frondihabitans sucicola]|uniref:sensor histidine kinase n=1 Tax=Frondihabitans sucicola TaxID=1268041 RepID=UPI0025725BA4|nr:sensor histidine kinase [Frondihabitans sucicola]